MIRTFTTFKTLKQFWKYAQLEVRQSNLVKTQPDTKFYSRANYFASSIPFAPRIRPWKPCLKVKSTRSWNILCINFWRSVLYLRCTKWWKVQKFSISLKQKLVIFTEKGLKEFFCFLFKKSASHFRFKIQIEFSWRSSFCANYFHFNINSFKFFSTIVSQGKSKQKS